MESILDIASYVFWVVLAITILVFAHEMGHFIFAKLFKMRVDRFSVGFPPKVYGKKIGETEYVIGLTPLGGYVKISGMVDESMDTDYMNSEPQPWEFRSKPVWQRIIVITAGVFFNIILAAVIFSGLKFVYGETYIPAENIEEVYIAEGSLAHDIGLRTGDRLLAVSGQTLERYNDYRELELLLADPMTMTVVRHGDTLTFEGPKDIMTQLNRTGGALGVTLGLSVEPSIIGSVVSESAADEAGLLPGDRIVGIADQPVRFWEEMTHLIQGSEGNPIALRWKRADSLIAEGDAPPANATLIESDASGVVYETMIAPRLEDDRYMIGVGASTMEMWSHVFGVLRNDFTFTEAVSGGIVETWDNAKAIVTSLARVFSGRENLRENLGGPIMIAQVTKQAAEAGPPIFFSIVAILSITLAIINILPIPALDGGHLMFLIYEGITRREPSLKVRMIMQQVGMIVLLAFMTFLILNDILRL